jgi:hypothetical protein
MQHTLQQAGQPHQRQHAAPPVSDSSTLLGTATSASAIPSPRKRGRKLGWRKSHAVKSQQQLGSIQPLTVSALEAALSGYTQEEGGGLPYAMLTVAPFNSRASRSQNDSHGSTKTGNSLGVQTCHHPAVAVPEDDEHGTTSHPSKIGNSAGMETRHSAATNNDISRAARKVPQDQLSANTTPTQPVAGVLQQGAVMQAALQGGAHIDNLQPELVSEAETSAARLLRVRPNLRHRDPQSLSDNVAALAAMLNTNR